MVMKAGYWGYPYMVCLLPIIFFCQKLINQYSSMLQASTLEFLRELREHNVKDWFDENRSRYQAARNNVIALVDRILEDMMGFEPGVRGLEAKKTLFRINRDIRFSKNKDPYKTNFGAWIVEGGKKSNLAGYYINIQPESIFIGGGVYMPPSPQLKLIRQQIDLNAPRLREIMADEEFKDYFGEMRGESLKTAPKGFEKDHPDIDLLRMKSFTFTREFNEAEALEADFAGQVADGFATLQPFIAFLNEGLKYEEKAGA